MVKYKSPCGYTSSDRSCMGRHITSHKCVNLNISLDDLCVEKARNLRQDISHLTEEEKIQRLKDQKKQYKINNKELIKKQQQEYDLKIGSLGAQTDVQHARQILKHMKSHSITREHKFSDYWNVDKVLELLRDNQIYKVGLFEFPMKLTNGYYNSASIDRIDDTKGYEIDNIEVRPLFLNSSRKLTTKHIQQLSVLRTIPRSIDELKNIVLLLKQKPISYNFFNSTARHAKNKRGAEKRNIKFDFKDIDECVNFLIEKYIEQGGRCYYSNIPINPICNDSFMASIERKNPTKSYCRDNIVLIVYGLNFPIRGQFLNSKISDEQREIALKSATFNQEYWNKCTCVDLDIEKINNAIVHDQDFLRTEFIK